MSAANRSAFITKVHRVLKKHYSPVRPPSDRSVLEHLLYACCLENAGFEEADEAFARLQESYFDWNEVRVTTVNELAECLSGLANATAAATRVKKSLQSVFETHYSFDLEPLKKENIGKASQRLSNYKGISPFVVSYIIQNGLGGHAIGIDDAKLSLFTIWDYISAKEAKKRVVPGLERAIPKTKGVEFFSLLHQLAADLYKSPFSTNTRNVIVEIQPESKPRLPKRGGAKSASADSSKSKAAKAAPKKAAAKKKTKTTTTKKKSTKAVKAKKAPAKKTSAPGKKKSATKRLARKKPR